ncbi:T9SS type A sorting domain-containing protein [Flavobacterium sp. '19STA2R22 D10 B1']|uniref:T9SS type A sorting domain-containing protein n=1 Tax=Flavobacterium aerium TaxID=3037261 RepID=UPI00278BDF4D|nr:T9SS type A sorting domain-containing protein [Flavobacterium sp. '19STA2R22 D10 B1']
MIKILPKRIFRAFLLAALFFIAPLQSSWGQIIGWNAASNGGGFGASPWTPETLNSNLETSGLIRGSSIGTGGSPAGGCWGGSGGWSSTAESDNNSFYFTFKALPGYKVSLNEISSRTRRSNAGPSGSTVWYSVNGGAFVELDDWNTTSTSGTTGTGNTTSLSSITALQNIGAGVVVKFRIIPQGSTGTYYLTGSANSLRIEGTVVPANTATPLITPSTNTLASFGDVIIGNNSSSNSFTFNGTDLTGNVTVTAPTGFQVSGDNTAWSNQIIRNAVSGSINNSTVWVRFSPTTVGPISGDIVLSSSGAVNKKVTVSGVGKPASSISVTPTAITTLSYIVNNGPSASVQLTNFSSTNLTPATGSITIAPVLGSTSNYEVSTDGTTWGTTSLFAYTAADNNINNPTIFVRLKAGLAVGDVALETINLTGGNASKTFTVSGKVLEPSKIITDDEPYGPYCNATSNSFDLDFTPVGAFNGTNFYAQLSNVDGSFPTTATNIVGMATGSPVNVTIPANTPVGTLYRVRVFNQDPLTFSINDNNQNIIINGGPTLSGITQAETVCSGNEAIINLTGLLANSTIKIHYTINGAAPQTVAGIVVGATGNASFPIVLSTSNNGQNLVIDSIERTDVTPSCPAVLTTNNSVTLAVNPAPTLTSATSLAVCGQGAQTTISLVGLLPNSTSNIFYTVGGGNIQIAMAVTASATGEGSFSFAPTLLDNGQNLEVVSITRTDVTPNCTTALLISVPLVVNTRPTAVIDGDQTICLGVTPSNVNITLTGTGPWNLTYTDGTTPVEVTNIQTSPYSFSVTTSETKTYTVTALQDAICTAIASDMNGSATITVNVTPVPTAQVQTFCGAGTVADLVATGTGIQWYLASTGGTALSATTTLVTGDYFATSTIAGCESTRVQTAVTVNVTPVPTTQAQTFCGTGTVADLVATGTGIQWYLASTGGTALSATTTLVTGNYFATSTVAGCESTRVQTAVTVNVTPVPTTQAQTFCGTGTVANLVATGTGIQWYLASTGGTALSATTALVTGNYFATSTVAGCESTRVQTAVTVNVTPVPTTQAQTFCGTGTVANLVATGTGIQWYLASTGGTALSATTALVTGNYFATSTVAGCESTRVQTAVTVNVTPVPTTQAQTFCGAGTVANLVATGTGIKWYLASTGGTALSATTTLVTGNYFATSTVAGCESTRVQTAVTISEVPKPVGSENQTFVAGENISNLEVTGTNLNWYASLALVGQGTTLNVTQLLVDGTTYYVTQTIGTCESEPLAITVSITLGTPNFDAKNLKYYPNPVNNILHISYAENIDTITLFNMIGQQVNSPKTINAKEIELNMSEYRGGTYFIKIVSGATSKTIKIIKN